MNERMSKQLAELGSMQLRAGKSRCCPEGGSGGQGSGLEKGLQAGSSVSEGVKGSVCPWPAGICRQIFIEPLLWARTCAEGWGTARAWAHLSCPVTKPSDSDK